VRTAPEPPRSDVVGSAGTAVPSDCRMSARAWFARFALIQGLVLGLVLGPVLGPVLGLPGAILYSVLPASAQPLMLELESAVAGYDQRTGQPVINFRMTRESGRAFAEITKNNIGRPMELRVDGQVLSKPVIREPILGGSGQISGEFTPKAAEELAARLLAGSSKLEIEVVD